MKAFVRTLSKCLYDMFTNLSFAAVTALISLAYINHRNIGYDSGRKVIWLEIVEYKYSGILQGWWNTKHEMFRQKCLTFLWDQGDNLSSGRCARSRGWTDNGRQCRWMEFFLLPNAVKQKPRPVIQRGVLQRCELSPGSEVNITYRKIQSLININNVDWASHYRPSTLKDIFNGCNIAYSTEWVVFDLTRQVS
jgi:hypothetical protein